MIRILLTGGGTAGHTIPIIAIVQALRKKKGLKFFWLGGGEPEKSAAEENNIPFQKIVSGKMRRYLSLWNLIDFFKIPVGIFQSFFLILGFKPDLVLSKGGYVSLPVVLAAWLLRKKIIVHESDVILGLANRIALRFASKVLLGFVKGVEGGKPSFARATEGKEVKVKEKKYIFVGNPIRVEIFKGDKEEGYKFFDFTPDKKTILIMGGGQGARFINNLVKKSLPNLGHYQIIHLVGPQNKLPKRKENYKPFKWLSAKKMAFAYSAANLVMARAGANSLAEIAAKGLPSVLIPLPLGASYHQQANARVFEKRGASVVLEQGNLSSKKLVKAIKSLLEDEKRLEKMSRQAKSLAKLDAASRIADEILEMK